MKIITSNPIITDTYSNLDGKSPTSEIIAFQKFALSKGVDLSYISKKTGKLVSGYAAVDGIWGQKTANAYAKYGADYEASKSATGFRFDLQPKPSSQPAIIKNEETIKNEGISSESKEADSKSKDGKQTPNYLTWGLYALGIIAIGVIAYKIVKSNNE